MVIVQGLPVLILVIWNVRVVLTGTVKVLVPVTVAVSVVSSVVAKVPLTPLMVTVFPELSPWG